MRKPARSIVVLGAGRVGRAIALDLAASGFSVTATDASAERLAAFAGSHIAALRLDLADASTVAALAESHDLVVGAVPGFMGLATARVVLECGRDYVDISFFPEDPFALDGLARQRGAACLVDCGIAPGCSNLLLGLARREMETIERFVCYVGGLPVVRTWPWEYKAPFSPIDVLEEYTRPARLVERGAIVTKPALSDAELRDFPGIGTLEAFNTDGLRTLLAVSGIPTMREMTLRYPGHIDRIRALREAGFLSTEPVDVGGVSVRPFDLTARLLFPHWQLGPGEDDFTVMQVIVEGERGGRRERRTWDLLDRCDRVGGTSSMARTTGYTCTAIARLVAAGTWRRPGVAAPEHLAAEPGCAEAVLSDLAERGIVFTESVEALPADPLRGS